MAKSKPGSVDAVLETAEELSTSLNKLTTDPVPELNNVALSVLNKNGVWCVVKVKFNPNAEVAKVECIPAGDEKGLAVEQFKLLAVREGIV